MNCETCHHTLQEIGTDCREQLEVIPSKFFVVEHVRYKYACRQCETVKMAGKKPSPIPKSLAGASLLTEVVVNKYQYHLPLYRQSQLFKSLRIELCDRTLGQWLMQLGRLLEPLEAALWAAVSASDYLQVDETTVKVLKPDTKGYMWAYHQPDPNAPFVVFDFQLTRAGAHPALRLEAFQGRLQTDGYSGYTQFREHAPEKSFGCNAHARRKFAEIVKTNSKKTGKAHEALSYYQKLYVIEDTARTEGLSAEERQALRKKEALPILKKMQAWLERSLSQVPPKSGIGKAVSYALRQWPYTSRYVTDGKVEMDTNAVENQIRPFALGRKNWLFLGNEASAQIGARYYSLIQSAKLNALNPKSYLHYVLTKLEDLRKGKVSAESLLPHRIDRQVLDEFEQEEFKKLQDLLDEPPDLKASDDPKNLAVPQGP